MARPRPELAAALPALLCLALSAGVPAHAQGLRALHVDALAMRADKTQVHVGEVVHLAIHVHVREKIDALDELVIPDVGTMQNEGDERHVMHSRSGTDIVETLTLEPTASGTFTVAGAYLDAIDARNGKPSRFHASPVRIVVGSAMRSTLDAYRGAVRRAATFALVVVGILGLAGIAIAVLRLRRKHPAPAMAPPAPAAPPPPARTARDDVADALRAYRAAPGIASAMALRAALLVAAGATAGATLRDALGATVDTRLRAALAAAERTVFGPEDGRDAASAELAGSTERWLR